MLIEQSLDWVRKTWTNVKLGDKRRNQRAIKLAEHLLQAPAVSLPLFCDKKYLMIFLEITI